MSEATFGKDLDELEFVDRQNVMFMKNTLIQCFDPLGAKTYKMTLQNQKGDPFYVFNFLTRSKLRLDLILSKLSSFRYVKDMNFKTSRYETLGKEIEPYLRIEIFMNKAHGDGSYPVCDHSDRHVKNQFNMVRSRMEMLNLDDAIAAELKTIVISAINNIEAKQLKVNWRITDYVTSATHFNLCADNVCKFNLFWLKYVLQDATCINAIHVAAPVFDDDRGHVLSTVVFTIDKHTEHVPEPPQNGSAKRRKIEEVD